MEEKYKIGFLGLGKMGSAILNGILNARIYKKNEVLAYDPNKDAFLRFMGVSQTECEEDLVLNSEIVILAVKPQVFPEIKAKLAKIKDKLESVVVVSIAAGITIDSLIGAFGTKKCVRVMPNTPAIINEATSVIAKSDAIKAEEFEVVKKIFESIGFTIEVEEEKIDEVVPLNGSMPAFLYYFAKVFIEEAKRRGFDEKDARRIVSNAITGSGKMLLNENQSIDELISDVCSKGGSTLAGLKELEDGKFEDAIDRCIASCIKRTKELGEREKQ